MQQHKYFLLQYKISDSNICEIGVTLTANCMWPQECHQNVRVVQIQIKQRIPRSQVHWMPIITCCKLTRNTVHLWLKEHFNNYWQYQDDNREENSNTENFHLFCVVLKECYGSSGREFMRTEVLTAVNIQTMVFQIVTARRIYKFSSC